MGNSLVPWCVLHVATTRITLLHQAPPPPSATAALGRPGKRSLIPCVISGPCCFRSRNPRQYGSDTRPYVKRETVKSLRHHRGRRAAKGNSEEDDIAVLRQDTRIDHEHHWWTVHDDHVVAALRLIHQPTELCRLKCLDHVRCGSACGQTMQPGFRIDLHRISKSMPLREDGFNADPRFEAKHPTQCRAPQISFDQQHPHPVRSAESRKRYGQCRLAFLLHGGGNEYPG